MKQYSRRDLGDFGSVDFIVQGDIKILEKAFETFVAKRKKKRASDKLEQASVANDDGLPPEAA